MTDVASLQSALKQELRELQERKEKLEREVKSAMDLLQSTSVGLRGRLVDAEGFPRDDVDLYAVRGARNVVACGENDLKALGDEMHEKLRLLHELSQEEATRQMEFEASHRCGDDEQRREGEKRRKRLELEMEMKSLRPYLRVADVAPGGPADSCGLVVHDEVVDVGGFRYEQFHSGAGGVAQFATWMSQREGALLPTWILRRLPEGPSSSSSASQSERVQQQRMQILEVPLVPHRWKGGGLIGCAFDVI